METVITGVTRQSVGGMNNNILLRRRLDFVGSIIMNCGGGRRIRLKQFNETEGIGRLRSSESVTAAWSPELNSIRPQ
ncbi:hypothetical protein HanPSC8_Chr13g0592511 [Helianthus annuus]|nr:hypothetical protein HanPSC8_Chr13g0592511 [Helianthus annuus]